MYHCCTPSNRRYQKPANATELPRIAITDTNNIRRSRSRRRRSPRHANSVRVLVPRYVEVHCFDREGSAACPPAACPRNQPRLVVGVLATRNVVDRRPVPLPTQRTLTSTTSLRTIIIDDRIIPHLRVGTKARTAVRKAWRGETEASDLRAYPLASTTTIAVERMGRCRRVKLTSRRSLIAVTAAAATAVGVGCQAVGIDRLATAVPPTTVVPPPTVVVVSLTRVVTETFQATYP